MAVVTLDVDITNSSIARDLVYFIYVAYMSKIRSISRHEEAFSRLSLFVSLSLSAFSYGDGRHRFTSDVSVSVSNACVIYFFSQNRSEFAES